MPTLTLTPKLQITQPPSAPIPRRRTIASTLWNRFLNWIETATPQAALKAIRRLSTLVLIGLLVFVPQFAIAAATSAATWNGYRIPIFFGILLATLNAKRIYLALRRRKLRQPNQHTFHGLPVSEFASFLLKNNGFKWEDAQRLSLSRNKYDSICTDLDKGGVTIRGENNSRVLRPISLEELVHQLRDGFPLLWDDINGGWCEKQDAYGRYLRDQAFKKRKLSETVGRTERKLARMKQDIGTLRAVMV